MKKSFKGLLSLVLALLLLPTSIPAQAATQTVACSGGGTFTISGTSVTESSVDCAGVVTIPASITTIESRAFEFHSGLTGVVFETGSQLNSIGTWAFQGTGITAIDLPDGLQTIGWWAFAGSKLTTLSVPGTVTKFDDDMFRSTTFLNLIFEPRIASTLHLGAVIFNGSPNASVTFMGPVVIGPYDWNQYHWNQPGYSWVGWSTGPTDPIVSFPLTVGANGITLHQYRTPDSHPVYYRTNEGTDIPDGSFVTDGSIATPPSTTREGYTFAGWSANNDSTPVTFPYSPGVIGEVSLFAIWTPNTYAIHYDSKGGSVVPDGSFVSRGEVSTVPQPPTRRGYIFDGWSASDVGGAIAYPYNPGVIHDITFYARWIPQYQITFDARGGSSVSSDYFSEGERIETAPAAPTRAGYSFLGWSKTADGDIVGFPYTPGVASDILLYAKWSADSHALTLDSKGGSAVPATSFLTDGQISVAPATPVRPGYTFHGWSETDGGSAVTFPYTPGVIRDLTLYATWVRDPYKPEKLEDAVVSGTGLQGTYLTVTTSTWDAFPEAVVSSQWYRCDKAVAVGLSAFTKAMNCIKIPGATKAQYKVGLADVDKYLTVLVQAKNSIGTTLASARSLRVPALKAPHKLTLPDVTGTAEAGSYLTATLGTWTSNPVAKTSIQWFRCDSATKASGSAAPGSCSAISGATKARYKLGSDDKGKFVTLEITAVNTEGEASTTAASEHVVQEPTVTNDPSISGSATVSKTLSVEDGSWTSFPTAKTTVQWYRCSKSTSAGSKSFKASAGCVAISGATRRSYRLTDADLGKYLSVLVKSVNTAGTTTVTADSTAKVE
ncbi:MAG: InlB B-repeat-containing protein [Rhodoluna sp.]|nr:InlB B-repeat-containing protein [Rhodoluna sp.]